MKLSFFAPARDYDDVKKLWTDRNYSPPSLDALSNAGMLIRDVHGNLLASTFVYFTNSTMALVLWTCVDSKMDQAAQTVVLDELVERCDEFLSEEEFRHAWVLSGHPGIIALYKRHGYDLVDDNGVQFLHKVLQ